MRIKGCGVNEEGKIRDVNERERNKEEEKKEVQIVRIKSSKKEKIVKSTGCNNDDLRVHAL